VSLSSPNKQNEDAAFIHAVAISARKTGFKVDSVYVAFGALVGFGSALTGTSGPLLFIPSFLLTHPAAPSRTAVATAQTIGVPMALTMTAGNAVSGQPMDLGLSLIVGAATGLFVPLGAVLSKRAEFHAGKELSNATILGVIAVVLIATGAYMCVRALG